MTRWMKWLAVGSVALLVAAMAGVAVRSMNSARERASERVGVSTVEVSAVDGQYDVRAVLAGECAPETARAVKVDGGYEVRADIVGEGEFDDLSCPIRGSVPLFRAGDDPVGTKVTVNGRAFTVAR